MIARLHPSCIILCLALLLGACSPRLDWRDIRDEGGYTIAMPARPGAMTRDVELDGHRVSMRMTAAEVDGTTFAVGQAALSDADATTTHSVMKAMQQALVANIAGKIEEERTLLHPKARADGGALPVTDIRAHGTVSGQPRYLRARFLTYRSHIYQLVIIGADENVQRDTAEIFFSSFRLN